jgi:hypothetical protein
VGTGIQSERSTTMAHAADGKSGLAFSRRIVVAALSLLLTVGSVMGVAAERVPTNGDSMQIGCRALQDRLYALVDEYGRTSPYSDRSGEIIAEIRNIGQTWLDIGCGARYGVISSGIVLPTDLPSDIDHLDGDLAPVVHRGPTTPDPVTDEVTAPKAADHENPVKHETSHHRGKHGQHGHKGRK